MCEKVIYSKMFRLLNHLQGDIISSKIFRMKKEIFYFSDCCPY